MKFTKRLVSMVLIILFFVSSINASVNAYRHYVSEIKFAEMLLEQNGINLSYDNIETINTDSGKAVLLTRSSLEGESIKELIIPFVETEYGITNSFTAYRVWNPPYPGTYAHSDTAILSDFIVYVRVYFEKTTVEDHFRLYCTDARWTKTNQNSNAYVSKFYFGATVIADKYSYPNLLLIQSDVSAEITKTQNNPSSATLYSTNFLMQPSSNYVYKITDFMLHTSHGWVQFTYYDSSGIQRVSVVSVDAMRY